MAMAHPCRRLAANNASLLQRLAEGLDLNLLVALPARSRTIPFWAVSSTCGTGLGGLALLAYAVLIGASVGSLRVASPPVPGSESNLEA